MARVRDLGCIVCRLFHGEETPAEIHHPYGKTAEGVHFKVLPLCYWHHRSGLCDDTVVSRHPHKAHFEDVYGTEEVLLQKTDELLGVFA